MLSIGTSPSHGDRRSSGLCGVALFAVLTAWTVFANPTVFATPGGGNTTITTTTSTTSHTTCGAKVDHTETSVTTSTAFGPATILIGENQSQTFFVAAGTLNINTNTHTETFLVCVAAPALSASALVACAVLLAAYAIRRVHRSRHRPPIGS